MKLAYILIVDNKLTSGKSGKPDLPTGLPPSLKKAFVQTVSLKNVGDEMMQAVSACHVKGIGHVLFVTKQDLPGQFTRDILPDLIRKIRERYPDIDFHYAGGVCRLTAMVS